MAANTEQNHHTSLEKRDDKSRKNPEQAGRNRAASENVLQMLKTRLRHSPGHQRPSSTKSAIISSNTDRAVGVSSRSLPSLRIGM